MNLTKTMMVKKTKKTKGSLFHGKYCYPIAIENTSRKKILIRCSKLMSKGTDWRNKKTHDLQNSLNYSSFCIIYI